MIRATLYLPNGIVRQFEAVDSLELVHQVAEYDRHNLVMMLVDAIKQINKKNKQLLALQTMTERVME